MQAIHASLLCILRYRHSSQAMSGAQAMGSHDLRHNQHHLIGNRQAKDVWARALQSDHLHDDNHLSRHVLKANGDCREPRDEARSGTDSNGRPCAT